jgi:CBS-domain-containing membrane protein
MKVQDVMTTNVRACRATDTLNQAAQQMWEGDLGCVPVLDEQSQVVGLVTDRDISMAAYTQGRPLFEIPVTSAMAKEVFSVKPKDELGSAHQIMRKYAVRRLPVVEDDGHLVGVLSMNDLVLATNRQRDRKIPELTTSDLADTMAAICQPRPTSATAAKA